MGIGRGIDHFPPAVEDADTEFFNILRGRQFKEIVHTIIVGGGDAVREEDIERAFVGNGNFAFTAAAV